MKNIKNILKNKLFIFLVLFAISFAKVNAANFVIGFMGQFGASAATTEKGKIFNDDFREFENSFSIQPGVFFSYYDTISSAVFLDIGYSRDRYEFRYGEGDSRTVENFSLNNISIGLLPRINFGFFSLGIGGGIKIPLSMIYSTEGQYSYSEKYKLDFGDVRDTLTQIYYPYLKASVDFLIKGQSRFMLTLGVYANYDFAFNLKSDSVLQYIVKSKENIASFDLGFQIGLYLVSL